MSPQKGHFPYENNAKTSCIKFVSYDKIHTTFSVHEQALH
jgi:hypothetical protein